MLVVALAQGGLMEQYKMILAVFMSICNMVKFISGDVDPEGNRNRHSEPVREQVVVEQTVKSRPQKSLNALKAVEVPGFVLSVPSGHFVGVSAPSSNLHEARLSAVSDVVRQILGTINVRYDHRYLDLVIGNVKSPKRNVDDRLSRVSSGIVLDVDRGIVQSVTGFDPRGRHMCYVLVLYPESKIADMRRLSRGSQLTAVLISGGSGSGSGSGSNSRVKIRLVEGNDVAVTLSSADVMVCKKNNLAGVYNFCIWKVPKGSKSSFQVSFDPVRVRGGSRDIWLNLSKSEKGIGDYLLGASVSKEIKLHGVDEIGRKVTVAVEI